MSLEWFTAARPFKLDVFEDTLFVTLYDHTIVRMHKFTGEHSKIVLSSFTRVSDVLVVHPLKQTFNGKWSPNVFRNRWFIFNTDQKYTTPASNPCNDKNRCHASSVCLLSTSAAGYTCRCPDDLIEVSNAETVSLNRTEAFCRSIRLYMPTLERRRAIR